MKVEEKIWTAPNIISFLRILLTFGFAASFWSEQFILAAGLFAAAGFCDVLDGYIARKFNLISRLGTLLDPLADKFLIITAFVCLVSKGWVPVWLFLLVVAREIIILNGIFWGLTLKKALIGDFNPSKLSKLNTLVQVALVLVVLFLVGNRGDYFWLYQTLLWTVVVLTVASGVHYIFKGLDFRQKEN
jgi:cardiolipin synthase